MTNCGVLETFLAFCQGPPDSWQDSAPRLCPDGVQTNMLIPRNKIAKMREGGLRGGGGKASRGNKSNRSWAARGKSQSSFPPPFLLPHQKGSRALYSFSVSTFLACGLYQKWELWSQREDLYGQALASALYKRLHTCTQRRSIPVLQEGTLYGQTFVDTHNSRFSPSFPVFSNLHTYGTFFLLDFLNLVVGICTFSHMSIKDVWSEQRQR